MTIKSELDIVRPYFDAKDHKYITRYAAIIRFDDAIELTTPSRNTAMVIKKSRELLLKGIRKNRITVLNAGNQIDEITDLIKSISSHHKALIFKASKAAFYSAHQIKIEKKIKVSRSEDDEQRRRERFAYWKAIKSKALRTHD